MLKWYMLTGNLVDTIAPNKSEHAKKNVLTQYCMDIYI